VVPIRVSTLKSISDLERLFNTGASGFEDQCWCRVSQQEVTEGRLGGGRAVLASKSGF
jgi:hypothetical protein